MANLNFIFRADNTNVGDWWCPPFRYFPFRPANIFDILNEDIKLDKNDIIILGGGGLGSEFLRPHLNRLSSFQIEKSILWGAGVDFINDRSNLLNKDKKYEKYGDYFDFINEKGIRVYKENEKNYKYVPCASCMNNLFFKYRDKKPKKFLGFYDHKRVPLLVENSENDKMNNDGNNLEDKLKFLSNYEYIVTNTYHGMYWGTLLERKVIVIPHKSGLLSFKYKPV